MERMRVLIALLCLLLLPRVSEAALLTISGPEEVNVGDTFALTVRGNSEGETAGAEVFVAVNHDESLVTGLGGTSGGFTQVSGALPTIVGASQGLCGWEPGRDDQCLIFEQTFVLPTQPADPGPVIGTFAYTAISAGPFGFGEATFVIQDVVGPDFIFFSKGNALDVGTATARWSVFIVPEPNRVALLVLGLLALALAGREGAGRLSTLAG